MSRFFQSPGNFVYILHRPLGIEIHCSIYSHVSQHSRPHTQTCIFVQAHLPLYEFMRVYFHAFQLKWLIYVCMASFLIFRMCMFGFIPYMPVCLFARIVLCYCAFNVFLLLLKRPLVIRTLYAHRIIFFYMLACYYAFMSLCLCIWRSFWKYSLYPWVGA